MDIARQENHPSDVMILDEFEQFLSFSLEISERLARPAKIGNHLPAGDNKFEGKALEGLSVE